MICIEILSKICEKIVYSNMKLYLHACSMGVDCRDISLEKILLTALHILNLYFLVIEASSSFQDVFIFNSISYFCNYLDMWYLFFFGRILKMMHTISLHAHENRMNASAVAACMAPLLLRPLLAGECELDDEFDVNGDNSSQLLAAANAANNAQAIINTLLEEYENIFDVWIFTFTSTIMNSILYFVYVMYSHIIYPVLW